MSSRIDAFSPWQSNQSKFAGHIRSIDNEDMPRRKRSHLHTGGPEKEIVTPTSVTE